MLLTSNEIFYRDTAKKISNILDIPEEVVKSVINALVLHILKDASTQADNSSTISVKIPKIGDISVMRSNKKGYLTVSDVRFTEKFRDQLKLSMTTDIDYLSDEIIKNAGNLIVDKYLKLISEGVDTDE